MKSVETNQLGLAWPHNYGLMGAYSKVLQLKRISYLLLDLINASLSMPVLCLMLLISALVHHSIILPIGFNRAIFQEGI